MAVRQQIRRRVRRTRPTVRCAPSSSLTAARMDARRNTSGDSELMIGGARDPAEKAADKMADRVMRMPAPGPVVHRKCADCEAEDEKVKRAPQEPGEEETAQTKPAPNSTLVAAGASAVAASPAASSAIRSMGGGKPLARPERTFFEPRFGADLSLVRIHDGPAADKASRGIHARAFTLGDNVAFAKGERQSGTETGRRLMAHELSHVLGEEHTLQRAVKPDSGCPNNIHGAPNNALQALTDADSMAMHMTRAADALLFISTTTARTSAFHNDDIVLAYYKWFGGPRRLNNGRFKSRFRGASFANDQDAATNEMLGIGGRLSRISRWMQTPIRYQCPGTSRYTIRGCQRTRCSSGAAATACPTGARHIVICPHFWNFSSVKARASFLAHESAHAGLQFGGHPERLRRRHRNPACYGGFLRDVFGVTGITNDQCNATSQVPPVPAPVPTPVTGGQGP